MTLTRIALTKPIAIVELTEACRGVVPGVIGLTDYGAQLEIRSNAPLTPVQVSAVTSALTAHDAAAIAAAKATTASTMATWRAQLVTQEATWAGLTTAQKLDAIRTLLRYLLLKGV